MRNVLNLQHKSPLGSQFMRVSSQVEMLHEVYFVCHKYFDLHSRANDHACTTFLHLRHLSTKAQAITHKNFCKMIVVVQKE